MKRHFPFVLSIAVHLIIIIIIILLFPTQKKKTAEEKIKVEIVFKKEEKSPQSRDFIEKSVDIIDNNQEVNSVIDKPDREKYIEVVPELQPDLVVNNRITTDNSSPIITGFNRSEFEDSLLNLIPEVEIEEDVSDSLLDISWDGDKRSILSNSFIDFASFPEESFTGVGLTARFMVNSNGEVYNVEIVPPGSGSIDFDILVKQYLFKFKFSPGVGDSIGEIIIVYKK